MKRVTVVGAGPAGMMAAIAAAEEGADVTLLERNPYAGKKLCITGKGRCNVTNDCTPDEVLAAITRHPKFLYSAVNRFAPADTKSFFESAGVPLKTERGRRVFPISDRASDIRDALVKRLEDAGVRIVCGARVSELIKENGWVAVAGRRRWEAEAVVIATGGVSYPGTGSTGDGHRMLTELGVTITPLSPSLVPIETAEDFSDLAGLSLKNVELTVRHETETVFVERGEMLFTHFGVSGPLVLSASSNMLAHQPAEYRLSIDLKPALDAEELDRRLISDLAKYSARDFINALDDLLPKKLIGPVTKIAGIDPRKKAGTVTREERERLASALTSFPVTPVSFRPLDEAIVTSGGVEVKELDPKTMELKKHPGLFCAGELIDVDAYTGGYNLQIAFATGRTAGKGAAAYASRQS